MSPTAFALDLAPGRPGPLLLARRGDGLPVILDRGGLAHTAADLTTACATLERQIAAWSAVPALLPVVTAWREQLAWRQAVIRVLTALADTSLPIIPAEP